VSFFNEANEDAMTIAPEQAATGPLVGFLEAWKTGWEQQTRASASRGIEVAMNNLQNEQIDTLRRAGVENIPILGGTGPDTYLEAARYYEKDESVPQEFVGQLSEYDKRVDELKTKYPDLKLRNSHEMWDTVKSEAQRYEMQALSERRTWGGTAGNFMASTVASMNPDTDPLNFWTMGIAGAGKTILGRIGIQTGFQGGVETINQLTGVQEERRLLGLEHGFGDAFSRVTGAAISGGVLQGVGELGAAGLRRWFRSTPNDPAPPPPMADLSAPRRPDVAAIVDGAEARLTAQPESHMDVLHENSPLSVTRQGKARTVLDLDYVSTRLDDWTGPRPWELTPKTDTSVTLPEGDFTAPDVHRFVERAQINDMARRADPDTFRRYDALAERVSTYRRWLDELAETRDAGLQSRLDEIDGRIDALALKAEDQTGKRAAKTRKDIKALEAEKEAAIQASIDKGTETPDMARVRRELLKDDEKMRDLAPLVSRAYARAQNKWTNTDADRKAVVKMMREAGTQLPPAVDDQAARVIEGLPSSLPDVAPILRGAPDADIKQDATPVEVASAVVAKNQEVIDEAVDSFRKSVNALDLEKKPAPKGKPKEPDPEAKPKIGDNDEIEIVGQDIKLHLDKDTIWVPNESGDGGRQITVRELLQEQQEREIELQAVSSCSLPKAS
jgi:hypothetical protein